MPKMPPGTVPIQSLDDGTFVIVRVDDGKYRDCVVETNHTTGERILCPLMWVTGRTVEGDIVAVMKPDPPAPWLRVTTVMQEPQREIGAPHVALASTQDATTVGGWSSLDWFERAILVLIGFLLCGFCAALYIGATS